jgi:hypothetical protein
MNTQISPMNEINHQATEILLRELGVVNTIRFLNQFRSGYGDYTLKKEELFAGMTLDNILEEMNTTKNSAA